MKKTLKLIFIVITFAIILNSISFANTGTLKDTDFLNVRESPSTSSNIVTVLPANASFEITGEDGDWYKIKYQDYTGYVSKQYVSVNEIVANTNIPAKSNSNGIINKDSKLYVLPLLNSTEIGNVSSNTEALVVSITGKWAYIQTDTASGWIFLDNINGTEERVANNTENVSDNNSENNEDTNDDSNNLDNQNVNDSNNEDENNNITDTNNSSDENNSSNTNNSSDTNNLSNSNESINEDDSNYPKTMYVNVEAVYIRAQPTTSSDAVASIGLNTPVTVNGEDGEWYKVHVTDGSGYMMKKYLSENKQ